MLLHDLLDGRCSIAPAAPAITDLGSGVTHAYRDVARRSEGTAAALAAEWAVRPGDRVALLAGNGIAYIDLLFGLSRLGAILVPLNWRLKAPELSSVLADAAPAVLFHDEQFSGLAKEAAQACGTPIAHIKELGSVRHTRLHPPVRTGITESDSLLILYTSGTTGRAKGAMIPHRQAIWNCINTTVCWEIRASDVTPIFTPMFHAGGLFAFLLPVLYAGGHVIIAPALDPDQCLMTIERYRCTVILGVPTLFHLWRQSLQYGASDFSSVRWFISGGAPCSPELMACWRTEKKVAFRQGYGLTEAGVNCFTMTDGEAVAKPGSVGKPMLHSRMKLVDELGAEVPDGLPGELAISGPHVTTGYWKNPDATAGALRGEWFHTGDIARKDADGFYYIVGRLKDMIISGGENIYAAEVEGVFREHPDLHDAALVGQPDVQWGEIGVLFIVLRPGSLVDEGQLLAFAGERLARYKLPRKLIVVDALPYSPYGKVQKTELRKILPAQGGVGA
jgi:fatty-acyl-CoA synthase